MSFSAQSARMSLPPPVLAILWLDAVLVAAGALSIAGNPLLLAHVLPGWTGLAFVGAGLTAASAALAAFMVAMSARNGWAWLPVPALALWLIASGIDSLALGDRSHLWGEKLEEAGLCLGFLLAAAAPLFALIVFMLRRAAPRGRLLAMALGGIASVGAASSLLALVHPHQAPFLDLGVHALSLVVIFVLVAVVALVSTRLARA